MNRPMTTKQAHIRHMCEDCKMGNECNTDCVIQATCSVVCRSCRTRNYFSGHMWGTTVPETFVCTRCGTKRTKGGNKV